jgi:hypothetical protein
MEPIEAIYLKAHSGFKPKEAFKINKSPTPNLDSYR